MVETIRMPERTTLPELLSLTEGARLLHVHRNTLRNWTNRGLIRAYRLGNRGDRRFALTDLLSFLSSHPRSD